MLTSIMDIYISPYHDPYLNIAIERYLLLNAKESILYLWSNNPCTILGRNQNIYQECQLEYMNDHHILPVRRFSGGGCVYQDLGNLNYTYIVNADINEDVLINDVILILKSLGIEAYQSGRNDILVNDKKISGSAYTIENNHLMYHGTLLIDVNIEHLSNALRPHQYKLDAHAIKSVKSRVMNLKDSYDIDINQCINAFINYYPHTIIDLNINDEIINIKNELENKHWIYNDCPQYDITLETKNDRGIYSFYFKIKDGIIIDVQVFSDCLDELVFDQNIFINKCFDIKKIQDMIDRFVL